MHVYVDQGIIEQYRQLKETHEECVAEAEAAEAAEAEGQAGVMLHHARMR